jgi:hypothetical protein
MNKLEQNQKIDFQITRMWSRRPTYFLQKHVYYCDVNIRGKKFKLSNNRYDYRFRKYGVVSFLGSKNGKFKEIQRFCRNNELLIFRKNQSFRN